jgi:hypothetical protein
MSITFRIFMMLACAYAGWETANFQLGQLPEPFLTPIGWTLNEETKTFMLNTRNPATFNVPTSPN